jgi:hypothetical protein
MECRKASKKLPPLVSQALEFHADASAALETWKLHLEGPTDQQRIIRGTLENGIGLVVAEELLMFRLGRCGFRNVLDVGPDNRSKRSLDRISSAAV